ncbi:MAG TPA: hypothetical protein VF807_13940 [Ktedonobacterales bacterium]
MNLRHALTGRAAAAATAALMLAAAVTPVALAAPARADVTKCSAQSNPLQCIQLFGDSEIAKRLTSLQEATTKVNAIVTKGQLTNAQAQPLLSQISTDESGLHALKTKLDAETTVEAARADVKSIYLTFRIYAVFLPKLRHVVWLDVMTNVAFKMTHGTTKSGKPILDAIQDAINKAPAGQRAQLNSLFADYKKQVQEAEAQIDAAQGQLPVLTPNTFNTDRDTYNQAFTALKTDSTAAHNALKAARTDLHQILAILKGDRATATPASATATP